VVKDLTRNFDEDSAGGAAVRVPGQFDKGIPVVHAAAIRKLGDLGRLGERIAEKTKRITEDTEQKREHREKLIAEDMKLKKQRTQQKRRKHRDGCEAE
jgi:hypothetical protein